MSHELKPDSTPLIASEDAFKAGFCCGVKAVRDAFRCRPVHKMMPSGKLQDRTTAEHRSDNAKGRALGEISRSHPSYLLQMSNAMIAERSK